MRRLPSWVNFTGSPVARNRADFTGTFNPPIVRLSPGQKYTWMKNVFPSNAMRPAPGGLSMIAFGDAKVDFDCGLISDNRLGVGG